MGIFFVMQELLPPTIEIALGVFGLVVAVVGFVMSFSYDFLDMQMRPVTFIELLLTCISGGTALFDALCNSNCGKCLAALCPFLLEFALWMAAGCCSLLSSRFIAPENYLYTPEPSCGNYTNHTCSTSFGFATGGCPEDIPDEALQVDVGNGTLANCFNSTHTCTLKESTGYDDRDAIVLENCDQHAMYPCWEGTDAFCFGVSFVFALMSSCMTCGKVAAGKDGDWD
jgi:hypothetical protein